MSFIVIAMSVIVFIVVFGLLVYFFNIFNSAQNQVGQVVHPTNNISHAVSADIHNAYTGFLPYVSYWMYAMGAGIVVALIFIIATSIREEEGE
jgi:glucan phosphoethanolaminetransferase (alkaline phosphatase superfamily)